MKKILFILLTALIVFSCKDFNVEDDDWYKNAETPKNLENYKYTITTADYTTIVNALNATGTDENKALATKLNSLKMFTPELDPAALIPYLLESKYYAADVKSSAMISYMYDDARDEVLSGLTGDGYTLSDDDYKIVWGTSPLVLSLTPSKSANANIPNILKERFPNALNGDYKTVEYYYSEEEPVTTIVESGIWEETMEAYPSGTGVKAEIDEWINTDTKGQLFWQMRSYSNNNYAQVSSYQTGVENDVWLITKAIDLTEATTNPMFSFDLVAGNYNGNCLRIFVSKDFTGNESDILTATWDDLTSDFTLPMPTSGYSPWASAGTSDLSSYKGEIIYIAFKYEGNDSAIGTKVTTTYQLDNVKVWEEIVGVDVEEKAIQYATYICEIVNDQMTWKPVDNSIITLQPSDYAGMGLSYGTLSTALAADYLIKYLRDNYYAAEGNEKTIVYRTSAGVYYADKFVFEKGQWVLQGTISEASSQFVRAEVGEGKNKYKAWIFDPTIIIPITKDDYQLVVDYVKANFYDGNEGIWDTRGNAEFYYGFSAYYGNVSYRNVDRIKDNTYPAEGSDAEKVKFMNERTKEGLIALLTVKYPDATPIVSSVTQYARIDNIIIYSEPNVSPANIYWSYTFECIGDKEWVFVSRESDDGRFEEAAAKE